MLRRDEINRFKKQITSKKSNHFNSAAAAVRGAATVQVRDFVLLARGADVVPGVALALRAIVTRKPNVAHAPVAHVNDRGFSIR